MELTEETKKKLTAVARQSMTDLIDYRMDLEEMISDVHILEEELVKAKESLQKAKDEENIRFLSLVDLLGLSDIEVDAYSPESVFSVGFNCKESGERKIMFDRICASIKKELE